MHDDVLQELIYLLQKLPGVGPRSATRMVLYLLKNKEKIMFPLARSLTESGKALKKCPVCGNIGIKFPDKICSDPKRDKSILCVVENVEDLWQVESSGSYRGLYHVLHGSLNALEGVQPEHLMIQELIKRAESKNIQEVILALNSTVNSTTTSLYIQEKLQKLDVKITKISEGMPFGAELNYSDFGTLQLAFKARKPIN